MRQGHAQKIQKLIIGGVHYCDTIYRVVSV